MSVSICPNCGFTIKYTGNAPANCHYCGRGINQTDEPTCAECGKPAEELDCNLCLECRHASRITAATGGLR